MISFSMHIPSIIIGFLLGYIFVSVMWIVFYFNGNWSMGFGDGYNACSEFYKRKYEKAKNCEIPIETEK